MCNENIKKWTDVWKAWLLLPPASCTVVSQLGCGVSPGCRDCVRGDCCSHVCLSEGEQLRDCEFWDMVSQGTHRPSLCVPEMVHPYELPAADASVSLSGDLLLPAPPAAFSGTAEAFCDKSSCCCQIPSCAAFSNCDFFAASPSSCCLHSSSCCFC